MQAPEFPKNFKRRQTLKPTSNRTHLAGALQPDNSLPQQDLSRR
jgi:hypothetical protein